MTASFSKTETMSSSHVTFIKYIGIWGTVFGFILTLMGCIPGSAVSSILIYAGLTLLMCGVFFCLAFRSLSKYEISKQTLSTEETLTDEAIDSGCSDPTDSTSWQAYLENVRKHTDLSNQTGHSLIIKIRRNGFTSFEMVLPKHVDPAIFSASTLAGLEASFRNSHGLQAGLVTNLIAVLKRLCSDAQFENGRSFVYDDGTITVQLWPTEKKDYPPKYAEVCDDVGLPSYSDVTVVDMETVDANIAEGGQVCSSWQT